MRARTPRPVAIILAVTASLFLIASCSSTTDNAPTSSTAADATESASSDVSSEAIDPTDDSIRSGTDTAITVDGDYELFYADPADVLLVWKDDKDELLGQLEVARNFVEADGLTVRLILNSGIYQPGFTPGGLHVEEGVELVDLNLNEGEGNFHLMPNGVFFIDDNGAAVLESNRFAAGALDPRLAVQSGPMMTIDGEPHPAFNPDSESLFLRNGVGVTEDGRVLFIQSTRRVRLYDFAQAFLRNGAPNALYLDGSIARMVAPVEGEPIPPRIPFAGMLVVAN